MTKKEKTLAELKDTVTLELTRDELTDLAEGFFDSSIGSGAINPDDLEPVTLAVLAKLKDAGGFDAAPWLGEEFDKFVARKDGGEGC